MAEQSERNRSGTGLNAPQVHLSTRASGQIAVMFALSMLVMVPLMGLIFDGGNIYVQRRTAQNAADAAALAGTHALMSAPTPNGDTSVGDAVCKYLTANVFGNIPSAASAASFVGIPGDPTVTPIVLPTSPDPNDNTRNVLDCSLHVANTIPASAAGVRVDASISFTTFVAGFLGKGIAGGDGAGFASATAKATSTIKGEATTTNAADNAPFIICGVNTTVPDPTSTTPQTATPTHYPILVMSGGNPETPGGTPAGPPYSINANAYGKTYLIHGGGALVGDKIDRCGDTPSWKGLANEVQNTGSPNLDLATAALSGCPGCPASTVGCPACLTDSTTGSVVTVKNRVNGFAGCTTGVSDKCVMIIPIAMSSPALAAMNQKFCVAWGAFWVTSIGTSHYGQLLSSFNVGTDQFTWTYGTRASTQIVSLGATN